jgi:hypothetical protein
MSPRRGRIVAQDVEVVPKESLHLHILEDAAGLHEGDQFEEVQEVGELRWLLPQKAI